MNPLKFIPLLFFLFTLFAACKTSQQNKKNAQTADDLPFSDEYYNKLSSNLERVQKLYCGLFVQYQENLEKKTFNKWSFNDSEDSMMVYTTTAGVPNKDGYWVFSCQFISNNVNRPVYSAFIKFEETDDHDTIKAICYDAVDKYTWENVKMPGYFEDVKFSTLKPNGEVIFFVKQSNTYFKGFSQRYTSPVWKDWRESRYHLTPKGIAFETIRFPDEKAPQDKAIMPSIKDHLKRLKTRTNYFFK